MVLTGYPATTSHSVKTTQNYKSTASMHTCMCTRTDGQTTRKHNASSTIYCTGRGIKLNAVTKTKVKSLTQHTELANDKLCTESNEYRPTLTRKHITSLHTGASDKKNKRLNRHEST